MDLTDSMSITNIFKKIMPDYFINFVRIQSFVGESWNQPILTFQTNTDVCNLYFRDY